MSESLKNSTSIEINTDDQVIKFKRNHAVKRCNHQNIRLFEDEVQIECRDCGQKINPVHWILAHLRHINASSNRNNRLLAEWQAIEAKLDNKNKFMCTHCKEVNTIDFKRLPSQAAVTRKLNVLEAERTSEDWTIEVE